LFVLLSFPLAAAEKSGDVTPASPVLAPAGKYAGLDIEDNKCVECHSDASKVKKPEIVDAWRKSVHYRNGVSCERCHSASVPAGRLAAFDAYGGTYREDHLDLILNPEIAYKSPSLYPVEGEIGKYSEVVQAGLSKQRSIAICARCHGLTPINPESPKNVFPDYVASIHGQSVMVKGLGDPERVGKTEVGFTEVTGIVDAAVCVDCHDPHETRSKDDPTSETYKDNIPKLCGSENCHASDEIAEKYGIVNAYETYEEHHHGRALKFGVKTAPTCIDCHITSDSTHKILSQTDPESMTYPDNRGEICAQKDCHGVKLNVGAGSLHGKDADTLIGNLIDLFYTILIPVVVGFFVLYVVLDFTLMLGKKGGE